MLKKLLFLVVFSIILAASANVLAVEQATAPLPEDGTMGISEETAIYMEWTPGDSAESHDIYVGTDYDAVNNATTASDEFMENRGRPSYSFEDFGDGMQYFWRVDEVTATTTVKGDVWTFTTLAETNGLVAWWKMDGPDLSDAKLVKDSSGFGNDGTMGSEDMWMASGGIDFNGGSYGASGIVFANEGVDLAADMGLTSQVTVSYVVTWAYGEVTSTNHTYDGRDSGNSRVLASECPTGNHIRDHKGGTDMWVWEAFNDTLEDRFIFSKNGLGKSWGDYIRITTTVNFDTGNYKIYVDDKLFAASTGKVGSFEDLSTFTIGGTEYSEMEGRMKDFRIYAYELTEQEIINFFVSASSPSPADSSAIITLEPLSWRSGNYAVSHDVYFGTDFDDVNDATTASAEYMGNQIDNTYDTGVLAEGMYFWRIDEINNVDLWKGDIWSFEVLAPMPDPVLWLKMNAPDSENERLVRDYSGNGNDGTMGSSDTWKEVPGLGNVIDFDGGSWGASGIVFAEDGNDLIADMNLTDKVTITFVMSGHVAGDSGYAFAGANSVGAHIMSCEAPTGSGLHFLTKFGDGGNLWKWSVFDTEGTNYIFADADARRITSTVDFTAGQVIYYLDTQVWATQNGATGSFDDLTKFTVGRSLYSEYMCEMTDFRIYDEVLEPAYIAELVGDYPELPKVVSPKHESTGNPLDTTLEWRAGKSAVSQGVYFGDSYPAVKNADTSSSCYVGQQTATTYDPCGLEMMKTYYWRVDQLGDGGEIIKKGPIWEFNTIDYIMVEDFESYDDEGNSIAAVWTDKLGWGDLQVSLQNDPCLSPINSMRLRYHVPYDPYHAIANRSFSPAQDWTVNGVKILTIHYYGDDGNFGLPAFVTVGDGTTDANVVITDFNSLADGWNEMNVSLPEISAGGVDLNNVSYMEIGFGDGTNVGMSASKWDIVYIDDIALYPGKCVLSESDLDADITGDCVVNYDDLDALAFNWLLSGYTVSAAAVSDDDLVLHYDFENNTTDSVAGNNGTVQNLGSAISYDAGHNGGKCIHFNATATDVGSNMIVPAAAFAGLEDEVTFSFWLKKDESDPSWYQALFAGHGVAVDHREIFMSYAPARAGNMVTMFTAGSNGPVRWSSEDSIGYIQEQPFDYTAWNHYAMVKDVRLGYMYIYVNGELEMFRAGKFKPITDCDKFRLGSGTAIDGGDSGFTMGSFDDFRMYNRALSHAEILTLAGQTSATVSLSELDAAASDLNTDEVVDFADYSVLAGEWLIEDLWP